MITQITAYENREIPIPGGKAGQATKTSLLRVARRLPRGYIEQRGDSVFAGGIVGSIDAGNARVEVLPKTSSASTEERDRRSLFNLLGFADLLPKRVVRLAGAIDTTKLPLLELIAREVALEIDRNLAAGPPRRYVEEAADEAVVRGRIDLNRMARRLPYQQHQLALRYAPLTQRNDLAALVHGVAKALMRYSPSFSTRKRLLTALSAMEQLPIAPVETSFVESISLTRYETEWRSVLQIAKFLARGVSPDPISAGDDQFFSFVFPLPLIFERLVRKSLTEVLSNTSHLRVMTDSSDTHLLEHVESENPALLLKPDIQVARNGVRTLVGDTKWKLLDPNLPRFGVSREDIFQLATYMFRLELVRAVIFFPKADWMDDGWSTTFRIEGTDKELHIFSVDMWSLVDQDISVREKEATRLGNAVADLASIPMGQLHGD